MSSLLCRSLGRCRSMHMRKAYSIGCIVSLDGVDRVEDSGVHYGKTARGGDGWGRGGGRGVSLLPQKGFFSLSMTGFTEDVEPACGAPSSLPAPKLAKV